MKLVLITIFEKHIPVLGPTHHMSCSLSYPAYVVSAIAMVSHLATMSPCSFLFLRHINSSVETLEFPVSVKLLCPGPLGTSVVTRLGQDNPPAHAVDLHVQTLSLLCKDPRSMICCGQMLDIRGPSETVVHVIGIVSCNYLLLSWPACARPCLAHCSHSIRNHLFRCTLSSYDSTTY